MTGVQDVARALERFRKDANDAVFEGVKDAVNRYRVQFTLDRLSKTANPPGGPGGVGSAHLRRACKSETKRVGQGAMGRVYFRGHWGPIAKIHETGGIIRPRRGKFLAVPTKYTKKRFRKSGGGVIRPRRIPNTFIKKIHTGKKRGALGIFEEPKGEDEPNLLFLLLKQVKIPGPEVGSKGRLQFVADWVKYEPFAMKILENARDRAVAKGQQMFR
jgi:hypothetical protein